MVTAEMMLELMLPLVITEKGERIGLEDILHLMGKLLIKLLYVVISHG